VTTEAHTLATFATTILDQSPLLDRDAQRVALATYRARSPPATRCPSPGSPAMRV
jgi:hypothetical protein